MTAPLIAIVGRPNVGKSTLFNRLVGGRPALVHDTPGLTRDRRYGEFDYFGHDFQVVDTGGLDPEAEKDVIGAGIHRQARAAIEQADAVLFVVDATAGITPLDREVAAMVRKTGRPVLCCANKIDSNKREVLANEIYALGLGEVYPVSAVHGRGVDDMLEALVALLELPPPRPQRDDEADEESEEAEARARTPEEVPEAAEAEAAREPLRVALLGKPNAGKSSLMNRLVGAERALVHHEPGTTMDPVDTPFEFGGKSYVLVDTAGIRRKARVEAETERIAVSMALAQMERADVVVLVMDGHEGPSEQDARLAGAAMEKGRALVLALNKADLLAGPGAARALEKQTREVLHFVPHVPTVLLSAMRGDGVTDVIKAVDRVAAQHRRRVPTAELNRFFAEVCETHPPPLHHGHSVRIHYLTQGGIKPPTFLLWANHPKGVAVAYRRFLINQLRQRYGFAGTPVRVVVKAKQSGRRDSDKQPRRSGRRRRRS